MRQIKVGIIGAGAISHEHCTAVNDSPHAQMLAVADVSVERREALARKHHISRTYATAEELLADTELDAVTIAVPNVYHAPLAVKALSAGKHVMLEKPFAPSLSDALTVARAARRFRKVVMVGMNQRFYRSAQVVKSLIDRGELGDIYHGKTTWLRRSGIPKMGTWFCRKDMAGGGTLLDIGVHMLDLCLYLLNNFEPETVTGATYSKFGPRGLGEGDWGKSDRGEMRFDVEDFATAMIKLRGGATVNLDVAWALHQEPASNQQVQIFGTDGGAAVFPTARLFQRRNDGGDFATVEPPPSTPVSLPCCRFANWIDAILDVAAPLCTVDQSLAVQMIMDAIYESAASGREVRIKPSAVFPKLSA